MWLRLVLISLFSLQCFDFVSFGFFFFVNLCTILYRFSSDCTTIFSCKILTQQLNSLQLNENVHFFLRPGKCFPCQKFKIHLIHFSALSDFKSDKNHMQTRVKKKKWKEINKKKCHSNERKKKIVYCQFLLFCYSIWKWIKTAFSLSIVHRTAENLMSATDRKINKN